MTPRPLPRLSRMSLRARLMLLTIVLLTAGLAISDIGTVLLLGGPLQARVDNQLRAAAGVMAQRRTIPPPPQSTRRSPKGSSTGPAR